MSKKLNTIVQFLKANQHCEFTIKDIVRYLNHIFFDESTVKFWLKEVGLDDVKFIHSREVCGFGEDFHYEAYRYVKGYKSKELNFYQQNVVLIPTDKIY